ncbi:DUF3160 domain-containing protein [Candidatus Parcubacteria bacterium]|nr:DUF3160 domain-containing protein [Candidatus Parcubacteria bacterium]
MSEEIKPENNKDNEIPDNQDVGPEEKGKFSSWKILVPALLVFFMLATVGVYYLVYDNAKQSGPIAAPNSGNGQGDENIIDPLPGQKEALFSFSLVKPVFARHVAITDSTVPSLPTEKPTVKELVNFDDFTSAGVSFSKAQIKALEESGFFLKENDFIKEQKSGNDDFADTYRHFSGNKNKYYREADDALFITSDAALHLYHILIDRSFQKIEETKFQPMLRSITEALFEDSLNNYKRAVDPIMKDSYKRLSVYYLIPLVVLDAAGGEKIKLRPGDFDTYAQFLAADEEQSKKAGQAKLSFSLASKQYKDYELSDEIFALAKAEIDLIQTATGAAESPLFTPYRPYLINDYSQFKPRSHYTKNDILRSYFIAMMWYGRMGFSLDSSELTRDAIIITGQINSLEAGGEKITKLYSDMAAAIEFFVGEVDDLTPYEYTDLIRKMYGDNLTGREFMENSALEAFIETAIDTLPLPRIVSEVVLLYDDGGERDKLLKQLMQFRFMGQRFTPDAYIINQLTQGVGAPDPETEQNLPSMSTALMPINIISPGNKIVEGYIDEWVDANAPDSDRIIAKKLNELKNEFAAYDETVWTQNIYWSWLNAYRSLLGGYSAGYPYFMTTDAWQKKNLGTALGSYAELKHDTLLYAKQSYAELGGGGDNPEEVPPVPKGYVEADQVFWSRITALAKMTAEGLRARNIMPEYFDNRYKSFIESCEFFTEIVKKELANETISEDDFEKLRTSGYVFTNLTAPLPGEELTDKERRAGIIADIHTDAVKSKILYEATGKPYIIYTAVKDINGARLTRGAAFNHYEFIGPLSERYADEDWQKRVYDNESALPEADKWSRELIK